MSYGIQSRKLKKLVDFYSPFNNGQELKFITLFKGQQGLLRYLQTSPFQGIDSTSLQQRAAWFGSNYPDQTLKQKKLIQILLSPINNFGMKLHIIFSIIAFIASIVFNPQYLLFSWLGAVINLFTFIIVYLLLLVPQIYQFYDNFKIKSFAIEGFKVKVWRDNEKKEVHSHQLVVGDVVQLGPGDKIGADGLLIQGNIIIKQKMSYKELKRKKNKTKLCLRRWASYQQQVKHFQLQLEDDQQQIELSSPIILAGSQVQSGQGRYVVLCVGKYSRIGNFQKNLYKAGEQRKSDIQIKISQIFFQISKYLVLALVAFILLFICKTVAFIIIQNSFTNQNWLKICDSFFYGIAIILLGIPNYHIIGLSLGSYYFKIKMYKTDEIWHKYAKDCGTMKQITSIIFDRQQQMNKINLLKWWNQQNMAILNQDINCIENINICKDLNPIYQQMLVKSLMCQDFSPYQVGLKINNFFIGANKRFISYIESALQQFGNRFKSIRKSLPEQQELQSNIEIEQSQNNQFQNQPQKSPKQVQIIYLKGSSETLLSQCTHIMHKNNGKVVAINSKLLQQITQAIQKMNALQQLSLITGYIEVHPNHPKFRQTGYKLVILSLIAYKENHHNQQFQSLANLKQMGISITLLSSRGHQQTYETSREMGFISMDRPSIQLRGYNFSQVVGGIICKSCKKSICTCLKQDKDKCILGLKNQDQFNRIYKHLNLISQANSFDKLAFSIGLTSVNQKPCVFGRNIQDVPAMRKSTLAATIYCQMQDKYVESAAELILPDNKLVTIYKLVTWSKLYHEFCRKYLIFGLTPSLVAFISNFISFLLFGNFCIDLLQFLWVSIVICLLFGQTFALNASTSDNQIVQKKKNQPILDKISHRQISSQVITQVLLLLLILIIGPTFIPQDYDKIDQIISQNWSSKYNSQQKSTICSGIYSSIFANQQQIYTKTLQTYHIHSRHFTFIFNLFTIMQILNYFNCCNIDNIKSINFIHSISIYSIILILVAIGLHITLIIYGSNIIGLYPGGLTIKQWAICLGLSLMVIIVGLIIRQLPYDNQHEQNKYKIWPNRCYNLAVMATIPRQILQDFQIDQELEIKRMVKLAQ